ncbi:uncharacterized protein [Panulirus ornatus]|uniref:uncharacterized protein n=1 Tax=Panulirus ornatus TaxID=150431 RepID=UPI003A84386F
MGASVLLLALVATTSGHTPADPWRSASAPAAAGQAGGDPSEPRLLILPHQHRQEVSGGTAGDQGSNDDLARPEDLVTTGDLMDLRNLMAHGEVTSFRDLVNNGELVTPGDLAGSGDVENPIDIMSADDLTTADDTVRPWDLASPEDPVRTGDLDRTSKVTGADDLTSPGRTKRKVISRGGHYIVWSRSGTSPWSSTSYETLGGYKINHHREYGWNPRGSIGDGGSRKFYTQPETKKVDRRASRKKLNKSFKREIAQYAMVYGTHKAAVHYEKTIGRRLRDRVVQKFVQRYQERRKRKRRRRRRRGHS